MQESSSNKYKHLPKHEIFSKTCIPPETSFFLRLDGWKFKKLSETIKAEKPFDKEFTKCLVSSGKTLFEEGFNPALIYVVSDELNILFLNAAPFRRRIEKVNSVLASLISSAFTLCLKKEKIAAFDSRIVTVSSDEKIIEYLAWRQMNAWRNHNNAYAYWILRKIGYAPSEISKRLRGLKTEELHQLMFEHGVNLARTPQWQRRGILLYKQLFTRKSHNQVVKRWRINEKWDLPLFTSKDGIKLIKGILELARQKRKE
ncbi:MAG: tRNA(His) guanylyltransferase Thg1 family protein [Candidatus Bathyarchaeota archaeon]|nr:tRNA(His) guanylyltransferase Thg1 family protein [Candidatus Bathyarchaeota archaeon]